MTEDAPRPDPAVAVTWRDLPIRDDLRGLTPYGAPQLDVPVLLNTNENPYAPSAELVADLAAAAGRAAAGANRYPDRDAVELRKDLAQFLNEHSLGHGLVGTQLWAANGSNEIIQQILQCFGGAGRTALGFEPSYSMHRLIALGTGTAWAAEPRDPETFELDPAYAVAAIRKHRPDVVFLTSPNNPTGTAAPLELIEAVVDAAPGMVVIDEAYAEFFRPGTPSALTLLPGRPRLIVTRTMSKAFAMAGARIGYLAADPAVIDALLLVRLPYHLSVFTQAVARTALAHTEELLGTVAAVKAQRDRIVAELTALGLHVVPSDANFVSFGDFRDPHAVWQGLLDQGVLIREGLLPHKLRVTAGTVAETTAFLDAFTRLLQDGRAPLLAKGGEVTA